MSEEVLSKFKGLYVEIKPSNDPVQALEKAIKKFKRMVKDDDLMLRIHNSSHFTKPSAKRRDARNRAKARARSQTRRQSR